MSRGHRLSRASVRDVDYWVEQQPRRFHCRCCGLPFSDANVFSDAGWLETQISGLCEVCFDTYGEMPVNDNADHPEGD